MYEGLRPARLATVLDCGHTNGAPKVYLGFQLADFDVEPQNKDLPIYKIYTKYPFGGVLSMTPPSPIMPLLQAYGWKGEDILSFLLEKAGQMIMLNIVDNEYQGKQYPIIAEDGHQPYPHSQTDSNLYQWGTDIKLFKFTPETTKEDIDAIGFENKVIKKSDEYLAMINVDVSKEEIDSVF